MVSYLVVQVLVGWKKLNIKLKFYFGKERKFVGYWRFEVYVLLPLIKMS